MVNQEAAREAVRQIRLRDIGGIIVIDFILDDKVRTSDDITKLLGLPTLGVVTMQNGMNADNNRNYKGAKK